jgi:glycosyltransferase involved in cell wall biosynthesis
MRVALWHNLPSGGGKRALYDHVSGLLARGHYIESWCPPTADQEFLPIGDLVLEHTVPLDTFEGRNWRNYAARLAGQGTLIPARLKALDRHSQRCAQEIDRGGFDVVLAGGSTLFRVTSLGRYLRGPALLYLQEPYRMLYEALPRLPWAALPDPDGFRLSAIRDRFADVIRVHGLRILAREELADVQAYDRVLVNSYFSRESTLRAYGVDAKVCYLGVDTERYKDMGFARKRLVVGIGAFVSNKRIEVVIEAVARIRPPRPALAWIANTEDPHYFHHLVGLAAHREVDFIPYRNVSHQEVVRILNEAAVMAYAPRLEPFGYAPLEAAACGLPVVAQAEGGVRETVIDGETGLLVDDDNELHVALERILDDEELARRMGAAARRHAESTWSLSAATDRLESHLVELVEGRILPAGDDTEA